MGDPRTELGPAALVTGTTRGLGLALARELLGRGWRVLGLARGAAALDHPAYQHRRVDLADLGSLEAALGPSEIPFPPPDATRLALVNNAAVLSIETTAQLRAESLSTALLAGAAAPAWLMGWMLRCPSNAPLCLVNISSGAAANPYAGWSAYCMAKAALDMAGAVLAKELEQLPELSGRKVAVVNYAPGVVDTAMQAQIRAADPRHFPAHQRFLDLHAEGALASPEAPAREIAEILQSDGLPSFSRRRFAG